MRIKLNSYPELSKLNAILPNIPHYIFTLTQGSALKVADGPQWTFSSACPGHNYRFPPECLLSSYFLWVPDRRLTHMPFILQFTFTFVLKLDFNFSYKSHWWNNVHILLLGWPKFNHKEHIILKMLKTHHSNITLCSAVHPRILHSSENVFGKYYYFSFIVKETDTERAKWFVQSYSVSQGQCWEYNSSFRLSAYVSSVGLYFS